MNFLSPIFLIPLLTGPILIIAGYIQKKFPPKEVNLLYGYRTKSAMKTQERWDYAQKISAKEAMIFGSILTLCCFLGFFIEPNEVLGTGIGIGLLLIACVALWVRTERALKSKFGNE